MKKIVLVLLIVVTTIFSVACSATTVKLHCDGEGCENTVEVDEEDANESWVIFCKDCKKNTLDD